jgi:glutamyl-tRNA synthetase
VGTAYIGLFNLAFARSKGGQFILRIEDTDQTRSTKESEQAIFDALRWVGLAYDEGPDVGGPYGPYRQSERLDLYKKEAEALVARGHAYRCTCSAERLDKVKEEQKKRGQNPMYDGFCRERTAADLDQEIAGGAPWVIRLKVPREGTTSFEDVLRGKVEFENQGVDDQVLLKSDGFPTYHLANVVDDHHMRITHVIRGEEWINSTPKHVLLYNGFGWTAPSFCHLPLLRNEDKSKVSKRKNPTSIFWYKHAGILPDALRNYLGLMGWTMPDGREVFSLEEMVKNFDISRITLGGPVFDLKKLFWLNGKYLREVVSEDQYLAAVRAFVFPDDYLRKVIPLVKERVDKFDDFISYGGFFFTGSVPVDPAGLIPKGRTAAEVEEVLNDALDRIDKQFAWKHDLLEQVFRKMCDDKGWKPKDLFMPIRVAVTGKTATPPLFETMEVLGREMCRRRVREALVALKAAPGKAAS